MEARRNKYNRKTRAVKSSLTLYIYVRYPPIVHVYTRIPDDRTPTRELSAIGTYDEKILRGEPNVTVSTRVSDSPLKYRARYFDSVL